MPSICGSATDAFGGSYHGAYPTHRLTGIWTATSALQDCWFACRRNCMIVRRTPGLGCQVTTVKFSGRWLFTMALMWLKACKQMFDVVLCWHCCALSQPSSAIVLLCECVGLCSCGLALLGLLQDEMCDVPCCKGGCVRHVVCMVLLPGLWSYFRIYLKTSGHVYSVLYHASCRQTSFCTTCACQDGLVLVFV